MRMTRAVHATTWIPARWCPSSPNTSTPCRSPSSWLPATLTLPRRLSVQTGGTVGKYIGDAVMAFWNSPIELEDHGSAACESALAQQARLAQLRVMCASRGLPQLHARIGINAGTVLHGNVGSRHRMEWGMIGDEVNVASRLEAMGKFYGTSILISDALHKRLEPSRFLTRPVDRVVAYGKRDITDVHELVGYRDGSTPTQVRMCDGFALLVAAYHSRRFDEALQRARAHAREFPHDRKLAEMYEGRCKKLLAGPPVPGSDWSGVHVLAGK
mmetsp:Transcript_55642/g.146847  ORF Transcript_55642/g.146847 Transcript_55642/m.146847 type:complete len:271 (+) Transcript_55642:1494-2306(+)